MNLYQYLDSLPELEGRVLTRTPTAQPGTSALVREQYDSDARPMYGKAALRTRQISVTLRTTELDLAALEDLACRAEDAVTNVDEHPGVTFVALDVASGLPAQADEDGGPSALVAVVRFALLHHKTPGGA